MRRNAVIVAIAVSLATGCVERRFVVNSEPPGALVLKNGKPIGYAPGDDHFVYYGNYHFTLIKPGYATLQVDQNIPSPWYEIPPLDLISEIFWPWHIEDVRQFTYQLQPVPGTTPQEILDRGQALRNRGQTVGTPPTTPPQTPAQTGPVAPAIGTTPIADATAERGSS